MTRFKSQFLIVLLLVALSLPGLTSVTAQTDPTETEVISSVAWSNDGTLLALVGFRHSLNGDLSAGILYLMDMPSQTIRWRAGTPVPFYGQPHFSPDGNRLVVARCQFVDIYDSATGELLHTHFADFTDPPHCVREIDWHEDGTRYITTSSEVIIWDATTYEPLHRLSVSELSAAAFQPGGDLIAVGGGGGIALLPSTLDMGGQRFDRLIGIPASYVAALAWNANGTRLIYTTLSAQLSRYYHSELGMYDLAQQAEILHMSLDTESAFGLDWSADEQQIATASIDGRVRVWDLATSTMLAEYRSVQQIYPIDIAFSPYGAVLAYGRPPEDTLISANEQVSFAVPDPSLDRLQMIAELCGAPLDLQSESRETIISQVETLDIPPACRADLLAVAHAIDFFD